MRHAVLLKDGQGEIDSLILIVDRKEAQALIDMAEAATKASPRKGTWRAMLKKLEALECW